MNLRLAALPVLAFSALFSFGCESTPDAPFVCGDSPALAGESVRKVIHRENMDARTPNGDVITGCVCLRALVMPDGSVANVEVEHSTNALLSSRAKAALEAWKYDPLAHSEAHRDFPIHISMMSGLGGLGSPCKQGNTPKPLG